MAKTGEKLESGPVEKAGNGNGADGGSREFPKPLAVLDVWTGGKYGSKIGTAYVYPDNHINVVTNANAIDGQYRIRPRKTDSK